MDIQTKERLVTLIARGTDTYEAIRHAIPELTENEIYYVAHNHLDEERLLSQITPFRYSREEEHHFLPDDRFELADVGKDILHRYREHERNSMLAWIAAISGSIAAIASVIALLR
ncbi:hypothetical protein [Selenomonas noxia]|jgi:hypothetical protein|uniref:hypothetical protein n=1 Tax=Selenomonas noxia TaxID=135083 RepID=UPI002880A932|nr:hypothetical protein [Selenomonas noxia]